MTQRGSRRSRSVWLFSALLALVFVVAGCSTSAAPQGSAPASKPHKAMTTVQIQLNWETNVEFSGLWVADHFGWLHKAGFKLSASAWKPGISPEDDTASCWQGSSSNKHKLCLGFDDSSAVPIARAAGDKLQAVWTGSQKTPFGFMTCKVPKKGTNKKCTSRTGKNITSPKQWKGMNIGYQSHELYVPEIMLASAGLSLSDVHLVQVGFDQTELYKSTVDAYLVFVNNEPITAQLDHVPINVIPAYRYGMGAFYADTMFAPQPEIKARSGQLKTFVRLVDRGWKWAMAHPKTAANFIAKDYFKQPSDAKQQRIEEKQFATTLSRSNKKVDGQMTLGRWTKIIKILRKSKGSIGGGPILSKNVKPKSCFTDKFAPKPGGKI